MAIDETQALVLKLPEAALANAITLWATSTTRVETWARDDKLQEKIAAVGHFFTFIGKHPADVTPGDVEQWRQHLAAQDKKPATIYARISHLSSFYKWLLANPELQLLRHFDHPQVTLGLVVVERDGEVVHKGKRLLFPLRQPIEQGFRLALFAPPALAVGWRRLVLRQLKACGNQSVIALLEAPLLRLGEHRRAARAGLRDGSLDLDEQLFHLFGPGLSQLLVNEGQLAQVVGIAQPVIAGVAEIRRPGVVQRAPGEFRQDADLLGGLRPTLGVRAVVREQRRTSDVQPGAAPGDVESGLIEIGDRRLRDCLFDLCCRLLQAVRALVNGRADGAFSDGLSEQIAHHFAGPLPRQEMVLDKIDCEGLDVRAVLRAGRESGWKLSTVECPAMRADLFQEPVFRHLEFHRRQIENLAPIIGLLPCHLTQALAAVLAGGGAVSNDAIRRRAGFERCAGMSLLRARFLATPSAG